MFRHKVTTIFNIIKVLLNVVKSKGNCINVCAVLSCAVQWGICLAGFVVCTCT